MKQCSEPIKINRSICKGSEKYGIVPVANRILSWQNKPQNVEQKPIDPQKGYLKMKQQHFNQDPTGSTNISKGNNQQGQQEVNQHPETEAGELIGQLQEIQNGENENKILYQSLQMNNYVKNHNSTFFVVEEKLIQKEQSDQLEQAKQFIKNYVCIDCKKTYPSNQKSRSDIVIINHGFYEKHQKYQKSNQIKQQQNARSKITKTCSKKQAIKGICKICHANKDNQQKSEVKRQSNIEIQNYEILSRSFEAVQRQEKIIGQNYPENLKQRQKNQKQQLRATSNRSLTMPCFFKSKKSSSQQQPNAQVYQL